MLDKIRALHQEIENTTASSIDEVESLRIKYISKKGTVNQLFAEFKDVPSEEKKAVGKALNDLKNFALEKINSLRDSFEAKGTEATGTDLTMPGEPLKPGTRH